MMNIDQFACKTYGSIEKAKCNKECLRATEQHPEGVVCSELRIRFLFSKDWAEPKLC